MPQKCIPGVPRESPTRREQHKRRWSRRLSQACERHVENCKEKALPHSKTPRPRPIQGRSATQRGRMSKGELCRGDPKTMKRGEQERTRKRANVANLMEPQLGSTGRHQNARKWNRSQREKGSKRTFLFFVFQRNGRAQGNGCRRAYRWMDRLVPRAAAFSACPVCPAWGHGQEASAVL